METNISPATQKFIEACDKFSVDMLREAIAEGADLNYRDKYGDSPFDNMVWLADNAYDNTYDPEYNVGITGDDLIEFASVLIDNGFDLTYTPPEDKDEQGTFWSVAKWGGSLKLLEFMLSKGLNPNYISYDSRCSALDELEGDVWMEDVACGNPEYAAYLYEAARLAVAYGALSTFHLRKEYEPGDEEWFRAAMNLDVDFFKSKSAEELIEQQADTMVVCHAKYGYPRESYYEIEKLQSRIIPLLDVIIEKIGIERLNSHTLNDCVELQYVIILEHLLKLGANPNVNCFNEHYRHIKSSAKYTLVKEGHYYKSEARARMNELLCDVEF
jgi:hypothetical protein